MRIDRVAGALLSVLGILAIGTGAYFLVLRPPMLPEDVEFTGVKLEQLRPAMAGWLGIIFSTLGAFVAGLGIIIVGVGAYMLTSRAWLLTSGVALGILLAFGRFLASNLILHSDFLWFIGALFALAALAALRLALGLRSTRSQPVR